MSQLDSASNATNEMCLTTPNSSFNSNNSSFSNEKAEDELANETSKPALANTTGYFSNSFELATSRLSIQPSRSEQLWSSTSKLEILSDEKNNCVSFKAQKRRGKLVRDRTIDNADEQSSCSNPAFSSTNCSKDTSNKQTINSNHNSNTNLNTIGNNFDNVINSGSTSPLGGSTLSLNKEKIVDNNNNNIKTKQQTLSSQQTGRISPPEKRVSLSIKKHSKINNINNGDHLNGELDGDEKEKGQRFIDEGIKQQQLGFGSSRMDSYNPQGIINSQDLNVFISHLYNSKLMTEQQIKHSLAISTEIKQSTSPISGSASSSPNSVASSLSPGLIKGKPHAKSDHPEFNYKQQQKQNFDPHVASSMFVHYDVYKDLQSKLNLRANELEEPNQIEYQKYPAYLNNTDLLTRSHFAPIKIETESGIQSQSVQQTNMFPTGLNHPFSIDHMFKNRETLNNVNNDQSSRLSPHCKNSIMKNFSSASVDSKQNNYLSTYNTNNFSNGQQNKSIFRSNSSPSYPSSPVPSNFNQVIPSNSLLPSSNIVQLNQSLNESSSANKIPATFQLNMAPFTYNKSIIESASASVNNSAHSAQNCVKISQHSNRHSLFNFYPTMNPLRYESYFQNNFDPNSLSKQGNRQNLPIPPEIVITESKSDNDHIEYDSHLNDLNNKKSE